LTAAGTTISVSSSTLTVLGVIGGPGALTKAGNGTLALLGANTYSGGTLLSAGTLSLGNRTAVGSGTLTLTDGAAPGAGGYGQLNVTGIVTLTGSTLKLALGFTPAIGETFTIINNQGTNAIVGTFNNLSEGATLSGNGMTFRISYMGGSGNSVVLTRIA
jgi:autotransporter-associated beta strand protein